MEYVFLNKENVFLEDQHESSKKIKKKEILQHLDIPVVTLNLYVESFFNILKDIGFNKVNTLFKSSLNGYKVENLISNMNEEVDKGILIFNYRIEASWHTSTEFDVETDGDEIVEFVKVRGWNNKDYFSIGNHKLNEMKSFIININNRYEVEDSYCNKLFSGIKRITLRQLIETLLYEITINKNSKCKTSYNLIKVDKKYSKEAKLKLIDLQQELEESISNENYERCADIKTEIDKYDKIIRDGK